MTKIFLIRHAEAEGNLYRSAHGQSEGLITPRGHVQIRQLEQRFADEKIDAVYSSDLIRAKVTATAVAGPRGLPINTTEKLREVCMGEWEELAWGDIERNYPELCKTFGLDPANWHVEGSEAYEDVISRVNDFITEAAQKHDGGTIALFCHGFAIRSFFCRLMGYASNESIKLPYCDNTAVALLLYDGGKFTIEFQSDNSHLSEEESTFAQQKWWRDEGMRVTETENMRYEALDGERDAMLLEALGKEIGVKPSAEFEFTTFLGDEPVGLLGISMADASAGKLNYIFLLPDFHKEKFGVQLIGKAITEFRKKKIQFLRFEAQKENPFVWLCKKHGFEAVSETGGIVLLEKDIRNW